MQTQNTSFLPQKTLPEWLKDLSLHLFFWISYLFYDTIATGSILDDFTVAFWRSFVHGIILAVMVYLNLGVFYPRYFRNRKVLPYITSSFVLVGVCFGLRTQLDLELSKLTYEEESRFHDPTQEILENLIEVELYKNYTFDLDSLLVIKANSQTDETINQKIIQKKDQVILQVLQEKPYAKTWEYGMFYLIGMFLGTAIVYSLFSTLRLVRDGYLRHEHRANYLRAENLRLKTQLNQHFLFNALGSIFHRFQSTEDQAGQALTQNLKWMIQYAIEKCEKNEFVSLEEELQFAQKYLSFHAYLPAKIHFPQEDAMHKSLGVMPMLLNPILENVIKHGNMNDPQGFLRVKVDILEEKIHLNIENSYENALSGITAPLIVGFGIGLKNLRKRLEMFYEKDQEYSFSFNKDEKNRIFAVHIEIPSKQIDSAD